MVRSFHWLSNTDQLLRVPYKLHGASGFADRALRATRPEPVDSGRVGMPGLDPCG
jgi:hypothetical protein